MKYLQIYIYVPKNIKIYFHQSLLIDSGHSIIHKQDTSLTSLALHMRPGRVDKVW